MPRLSSRRLSAPLLRLGVLLLALQCLTGCGGCTQQTAAQKALQQQKDKEAAEKKKKEEAEKQKDPFELAPVTPMLSEGIAAADKGGSLRLAKPGHWTATVQQMRANEDDFEGRDTVAMVDSRDRPLAIPETDFAVVSTRPAILAKGRAKRVQNELLPPEGTAGQVRVRSALARGGAEIKSTLDLWSMMPSHQYFLVVLAREPARYTYLKVADAVRAPFEDDLGETAPPHYRILLADAAKPAPLPQSVLNWTSVAYLVWDEVDPAKLDEPQQQALVDWIHWGGRLIINGPDSLVTLRGSFLDKYLPVDAGKSITVDADDLEAFNAAWNARADGKKREPIAVTKPWSGVELKPRPAVGRALRGGEGLFYESSVGAGSIAVSAVQLGERDLVNWPGFDGFLNGALLRRPPRRFTAEQDGVVKGLQTTWARKDDANRARDAYFTTPLRWFTRDAETKANNARIPAAASTTIAQPGTPFFGMSGAPIPETEPVIDRPGGLGAWNEFGPVSDAARSALASAAGVRVPGANFVVVCLAIYLIVLVPLNWMLFQGLGRIEWAWIAAPLIALAATVAVVRQAQLDIGFVRSQTEIALLELQGDHPRGHLSRYMAFYSSLSTMYDAEFDDPTAVAAPFPTGDDVNRSTPLLGDGRTTVEFEKYDRPRLRGIPVSSASTRFVHSEQMQPLAGSLRLSHPSTNQNIDQVENKTGFDLADAVVVHRNLTNGHWRYRACWLGELRNGSSQSVAWVDAAPDKDKLFYDAERAAAAKADFHKRLDVDSLLKLAFNFPAADDPLYGDREEWRLVARLDETLPGATTTPAASQITAATVILAHLRFDLSPAPGPDENSPNDVAPDRRPKFDDDLPAADDGLSPDEDPDAEAKDDPTKI